MLQAQKQIKLKELVGDIKEEEEPAGEDIVGPGGEVIEGNSGNALFLPLFFLDGTSHHVCFVSPVDESSEEEEIRGETKEEQEFGVVWSWMEVGGLPMLAEEEAQKLLQEVNPLLPNTYMIF